MSGDLSAINNGDWVLCILRREPRQSLIIHSLPARSTRKFHDLLQVNASSDTHEENFLHYTATEFIDMNHPG